MLYCPSTAYLQPLRCTLDVTADIKDVVRVAAQQDVELDMEVASTNLEHVLARMAPSNSLGVPGASQRSWSSRSVCVIIKNNL